MPPLVLKLTTTHTTTFCLQRCDATRPVCQRCLLARYQDQCLYDAAAPPDSPIQPSHTRRLVAGPTSSSGDTPRPGLTLGFIPGLDSSHVLLTPLQPGYLTDRGNSASQVPVLQDAQPTAPVSPVELQLQKGTNHSQPHIPNSYYRSHQTHHDQGRSSHPPNNEDEAELTEEAPVVLRTTALVPSSPLLKSTIFNSHSSEAVSDIRADPTSPYYAFQDTRLTPNPMIRIFMSNQTNPRMFSLQNISPDTLSLLL